MMIFVLVNGPSWANDNYPNLTKLPDELEISLEKLGENKILRESFGTEVIDSYLKLKKEEIKNFFRNESFDKKSDITEWEKNNTLDC